MKKSMLMKIRSTEMLSDGIYRTILEPADAGEEIGEVIPGQFIGIYPNDPSALLPRPISICRYERPCSEAADKETTAAAGKTDKDQAGSGALTIVYRTAGKGTAEIAAEPAGTGVRVLGLLGNGYDLTKFAGKESLLLGGGIGIPPMLELAARIREENKKLGRGSVTVALGYRTNDLFLKEEFEKAADKVLIATDDGSCGVHGTCITAVTEAGISCDAAAACGPMPMLRGVKQFAAKRGIPAYISLEERMACGVGVCLGCVAKTVNRDEHSRVNNARVCTEGPVFLADDVAI